MRNRTVSGRSANSFVSNGFRAMENKYTQPNNDAARLPFCISGHVFRSMQTTRIKRFTVAKLFECCVTLFSIDLTPEHFSLFLSPFHFDLGWRNKHLCCTISASPKDAVCAKEILIFHCVNCNKWGARENCTQTYTLTAVCIYSVGIHLIKFEYLFYILHSNNNTRRRQRSRRRCQ